MKKMLLLIATLGVGLNCSLAQQSQESAVRMSKIDTEENTMQEADIIISEPYKAPISVKQIETSARTAPVVSVKAVKTEKKLKVLNPSPQTSNISGKFVVKMKKNLKPEKNQKLKRKQSFIGKFFAVIFLIATGILGLLAALYLFIEPVKTLLYLGLAFLGALIASFFWTSV